MGSLVRATRGLGARLWLAGLLVGGVSDAPAARQACTPQPITRLGGISPFQASGAPSLSADGRYTAFESSATDLDPNFGADIFVHDRLTCTLELVSVSSDEVPGNSSSRSPSISADGRFVAFESTATNLVAADASNFLEDIYVRDRQLGLTMLASVDSAGVQPVSGRSTRPRISGDGQIVAYISTSTTLVPGDTNAETDVFVRDLMNATTERASVATGGAEGESSSNSGAADHALSVDARFIAFVSRMSNLVPGDSGTSQDVFVRDRLLDTTVLASLTSSGGQLPTANPGSPSLTADGRLVFFSSTDTFVTGDNTCDGIFVRDLVLNSTSCPILDPNNVNLNQSGNGVLVSADGRYVAFTSSAGHYTPGDTNGLSDVFVYDRTNGALRRASTTVYGAEAGGVAVSLSADGQVIAFVSNASNLVPGDVNSASDVFVTVWGSLSVTPEFDLMRNGSFTTGLQFWQTFATPDPSYIVTDTTGGLLRFYRVPPPPGSANQAVAFQSTYAQLFPHAPLEARFRLGNSSSVRKRLSVLVHDGDFSDLSVCVFWLAPAAPLRDYVMRAHTTKSWSNATISFYAATAGSDGGFYQVDNVSLVYHPALDDDVVDCIDPTAPVAPGGAPGPTLLANGDFSAGLAPWTTFGQISWQIVNSVFEFFRPPGTPAGVLLQPTGQPLAQDAILTAAFYLGNSSAVRKRVTVLLHDADFTDLAACTFWMPPQLPLSPYFMRTYATKAWASATVSVYPSTVGPESWMQFTDATLQLTPASMPLGTECIEPGANTLLLAERGLTAAMRRPSTPARAPDTPGGTVVEVPARTAWQRTVGVSVPAHTRRADIQISLDGVTWTTIAGLRPADVEDDDWTIEVDLSRFAGHAVRVRLLVWRDDGT